MRAKVFYLATAVLVLSFSEQGFCMAKRPRVSKKPQVKQVELFQNVTGKVSGYVWAASQITIAPANGTSITIEIDKAAKILKSGNPFKMTDIKVGDAVTVEYEVIGTKKIAKTIIVQVIPSAQPIIPKNNKR